MENKPKMVKQWWLLFHDTKPELNFISTIARTELLNHVHQHVISVEDYQALESALESANAEIERLKLYEISGYETMFNDLKSENKKLADELVSLKQKHEELLRYLPKVPTQPYEKELSMENKKLREALEEISKYTPGHLNDNTKRLQAVVKIAHEALEELK